jgi:riboflavin-specific deaminase-like protein
MCGATTVMNGEVSLGTGGEKYRRKRRARGLKDEHVRVIVSGSGSVDPKAYIFTKRFSPIIILTTERAGERLKVLHSVADAVHVSEGDDLDFVSSLRWLRTEWGVKRMLCEGGGEVNGGLFLAGVVDEIFLTIAPTILGGRHAPTMADGDGFTQLASALPVKLKQMKRVGDELYTIWRFPRR